MATTAEELRARLRERGVRPLSERPSTDPAVREQLRAQGILPTVPPQPTFGEQAGAAAQGFNQGMANTLPILGGIGGAILGGPNPLSVGLGIGAGEAARRAYLGTLDVPTTEELPPELRPFAVGGEIVGGSIVPSAAPLIGAGQTGMRFIDRMLQTARRNPKLFLTSEAVAAAGAGIGGGIGEGVAPGNVGAQLLGGTVGGIAGSGVGLYAGVRLLEDGINRARSLVSTTAIENRAADELRRVFAESGDNPAQVARLLRDLPAGDSRTAAQAVDSPALALLEAELSSRSPKFARESAKQASEALETMRQTISRLSQTGDPAAMQEAARMRDDYFRALLSDRLQTAEAEAVEAAARISGDSPTARAELSRRTHEILDTALDQARAAERAEWAKIPGHTLSPGSATIAEATRIAKEDLLPEEGLPPLVRAFTARIARRRTTVREMLLFRSRMLDNAREAAAGDRLSEARIFGHMAEAALEDLSGTANVDAARSFSRTLNDVFTRSFAGRALAEDARGALRIPPEVLLRRATAGPAELTNLRLNELSRAVQLGSPEAADEMLDIQRRLIAITASELADPTTGLVSAPRLSRFTRANAEILERFPEVREILQSVESANDFLDATRRSTQTAQRRIAQDAAFTRVAGEENTVRAIDRVVRGTSPERQFRQLALVAKRDGQAAVEGLRTAVLENAFERAGGSAGEFSFSAYRAALLDPPRPGAPSAMDLMSRNGVIDRTEFGRLSRLLQEADRVETVIRTRPQLESLLQNESALMDLALRVAGSKAGTLAGGANTGSTLIAASAGSRFARHVFNKIPVGRTQEALIEAAKEPQIMAALLERPRTEAARFTIARKLNAWLVGVGLIGVEEQGQQGPQ